MVKYHKIFLSICAAYFTGIYSSFLCSILARYRLILYRVYNSYNAKWVGIKNYVTAFSIWILSMPFIYCKIRYCFSTYNKFLCILNGITINQKN